MYYFNILELITTRLVTAKHICGFSLLILPFCIVNNVSAQQIGQVHLQNGSIINGVITEQVPDQYLKIQTADGSVFVYSYDELDRITKEVGKKQSVKQNNSIAQNSKTPRYEGGINLIYSIELPGNLNGINTNNIGISTSHGCLIIPYLYVGLGAKLEYYYKPKQISIPIFCEVRGYFTQSEFKPYANFQIGYNPISKFKSLYISPSIGLKYKIFDINIGYACQPDCHWYDYFSDSYIIHVSSITIGFGVRF